MIGRRHFITLLGGAAAGWPLAARAQQLRRLGVLMNRVKTDLLAQIAARGARAAGGDPGGWHPLWRNHRWNGTASYRVPTDAKRGRLYRGPKCHL